MLVLHLRFQYCLLHPQSAIWARFLIFSPTALAFGSSAIVKVFGQNCLQTLYGSLGQICLGAPEGSTEGSTKVAPRFHQGSTKIAQVSWCLITFLNLFSSWNSFLHFSSTTLALRSSAIVKILGPNDTFVFLGSLQQMAFASPKVLWSVPQTVLCIGLTVSCGFWAHGCCFRKVLWRVPPTILYICLPNGCCFRKVVWRVPPTVLYIYLPVSSWGQHLSSIQIQSAENDPSCRCCWGILWAYLLSQASVSRLVYSMQVDLCFVIFPIAW